MAFKKIVLYKLPIFSISSYYILNTEKLILKFKIKKYLKTFDLIFKNIKYVSRETLSFYSIKLC